MSEEINTDQGPNKRRKHRAVQFIRPGTIFIALNIPPGRCREISRFLEEKLKHGFSDAKVIDAVNKELPTTDGEYTAIIYTLGFMRSEIVHLKKESPTT